MSIIQNSEHPLTNHPQVYVGALTVKHGEYIIIIMIEAKSLRISRCEHGPCRHTISSSINQIAFSTFIYIS
jgi:hypothetical protein